MSKVNRITRVFKEKNLQSQFNVKCKNVIIHWAAASGEPQKKSGEGIPTCLPVARLRFKTCIYVEGKSFLILSYKEK